METKRRMKHGITWMKHDLEPRNCGEKESDDATVQNNSYNYGRQKVVCTSMYMWVMIIPPFPAGSCVATDTAERVFYTLCHLQRTLIVRWTSIPMFRHGTMIKPEYQNSNLFFQRNLSTNSGYVALPCHCVCPNHCGCRMWYKMSATCRVNDCPWCHYDFSEKNAAKKRQQLGSEHWCDTYACTHTRSRQKRTCQIKHKESKTVTTKENSTTLRHCVAPHGKNEYTSGHWYIIFSRGSAMWCSIFSVHSRNLTNLSTMFSLPHPKAQQLKRCIRKDGENTDL